MKCGFKTILTSTVSAAAIAMSWASAASAQGTQQAQGVAGLEEITVTARRVEENVQRVPISVTALSSETLADRGITDINLLQQVVPSFNKALNNRGGFAWIRGLEGIAGYFADAPFSIGSFGQNFDVGSFQVLKGPQGTLFGQSSAGGAIVVNPVRPSDTFGGYVKATLGSYGLRNLQGAVNYPVIDDKLLLRVAADSYYRKGFVKNIDTGKEYANENSFTIRPSLTWRINDSIENYTMLSYYYSHVNGRPNFIINYDPAGVWAARVGAFNRNGETPGDIAGRSLDSQMGKYRVTNVEEVEGFSGLKDKVLFIVNETNWDVTEDISLKNIFSYNSSGTRSRQDAPGDGFFFNASNYDAAVEESLTGLDYTKTWSDELKVASQWWDDRINLTLGTFHTATVHPNSYGFNNAGYVPSLNVTKGVVRTPVRSRAIYGQGNVDLSDSVLEGLSLTLGYRKTWDKTKQSRWQLRPNMAIPYRNWEVIPPAGSTIPGPPHHRAGSALHLQQLAGRRAVPVHARDDVLSERYERCHQWSGELERTRRFPRHAAGNADSNRRWI
jgi:iron complex outermembrane receptor protein